MLELAHRPRLVEELYNEQQRVSGTQELTYDDLPRLALHNAVIKETLRLHSPIHSVMRKVKSPMPVPDTDIVVPRGHVLLAAPGVPSRMEQYFPRPMEWDPLRWLEASTDKEEKQDMSSQSTEVLSKAATSPYLPFGAGRHRCVGETFAYAQLTTILATFVKLLKFEQVDPQAQVPATDYSSMFSRPVHPATIRWSKR